MISFRKLPYIGMSILWSTKFPDFFANKYFLSDFEFNERKK